MGDTSLQVNYELVHCAGFVLLVTFFFLELDLLNLPFRQAQCFLDAVVVVGQFHYFTSYIPSLYTQSTKYSLLYKWVLIFVCLPVKVGLYNYIHDGRLLESNYVELYIKLSIDQKRLGLIEVVLWGIAYWCWETRTKCCQNELVWNEEINFVVILVIPKQYYE